MLNNIADRDKDGENNEMKYNPQCGVSKEVFEWRCRQHERVSSRTPELMRKIRGLTERMRKHFEDDVEGLKHWDVYERNVLYAYEHNLQSSLSRPVMIPTCFARLGNHDWSIFEQCSLQNLFCQGNFLGGICSLLYIFQPYTVYII
ncbi:unnamed protein product [Urochloa decumbens]|uniref:Uncharacterized protein n=1 Tax=Urochloa decumbens TaxID=240449 RepID=A0ABC9CTB9_9POAL